jgi:hypothetical protein
LRASGFSVRASTLPAATVSFRRRRVVAQLSGASEGLEVSREMKWPWLPSQPISTWYAMPEYGTRMYHLRAAWVTGIST